MPAIALEAEVFRIWRLANPNMKVPALLAAGADYVAWQAARARMRWYTLDLHVERTSLRIVCRKLCGVRPRPAVSGRRPPASAMGGLRGKRLLTAGGPAHTRQDLERKLQH
jgi:hypothetical protein